jgi:DNA-binding CsgD family transcriptional regulator
MRHPYGITPRQAEILDALIEHDVPKRAADALGLSVDTIESHMGRVRERVPWKGRIRIFVEWDRYRRAKG